MFDDFKISAVQRTRLYLLQFPSGGGGGTGFSPPTKGTGTKQGATNPQLVTSTGGLFGTTGLLLTPVITPAGRCYIINHDSSDFNTEENAEFDYRQELPGGQEGRDVTCHLIILKYRELGQAFFNINITVFQEFIDDFVTISIPVQIPVIKLKGNRLKTFPDKKIHTIELSPPKGVIQGERPQVSITRLANSGPISITKLILCGNADESAER